MRDPVFNAFLEECAVAAQTLNGESDLVHLEPFPSGGGPPRRYLLDLRCHGLVRAPGGEVEEWDRWLVSIFFPDRYLKTKLSPFEVLALVGPTHAWHPNMAGHAPLICVGHLPVGMDLVSLVHQVWSVIAWHIWRSDEGLNRDAARWARQQPPDRFPIERRPLKWRAPAEAGREVQP